MLHALLLTFGLVAFAFEAIAEGKEERDIPIAVSIFGPASSNLGAYDRSNNFICLGLINCASLDVLGLTAAYGYNHVYRDMRGVSVGLFGNFVANEGKGWELGLLANINKGRFHGLQFSSVNIAGGDMNGAQFGLLNYVHGAMYGLQMSAVNTVVGLGHDVQAGFLNYSHEGLRGMQLGLMNGSGGETVGFQLAALANYSHGSAEAVQLSLLNINAGPDAGPAMALQVGLVNISNQSRVIPVGVFNFVRGGRLNLELSRNTLGFNSLTLLTGSQYFYSILNFDSRSINPDKRESHHPRSAFLRAVNFGAAFPIRSHAFVRLEQIIHAPTNYKRDRMRINRLVGEFSPSSYFSYHVGLEQIRFHEEADFRSPILQSYRRQLYSLTAGIAVPMLAWWTSPAEDGV